MSNCHCVDKNSQPKQLYTTEKQAEEQREYQSKEKNIELQIYSCPNVKHGWHLTSSIENREDGYARAEKQAVINQNSNYKPLNNKIKGFEKLKKK